MTLDPMACWGWGYVAVSLLFTAIVARAHGRVARLEIENRRLREWQASQSKAPELGPHRSAKPRECDPCMSPDHLHFDPRAALEAINPDRPPRPAPTSIPSGGRVIE